MATGAVKWFDERRGYGFITPDGGGQDLFFHRSAVAGRDLSRLRENVRVEYELVEGPRGLRAANVRLATR